MAIEMRTGKYRPLEGEPSGKPSQLSPPPERRRGAPLVMIVLLALGLLAVAVPLFRNQPKSEKDAAKEKEAVESTRQAAAKKPEYRLSSCSWWSAPEQSEVGGKDGDLSRRTRNHKTRAKERARVRQPLVQRINQSFDSIFGTSAK